MNLHDAITLALSPTVVSAAVVPATLLWGGCNLRLLWVEILLVVVLPVLPVILLAVLGRTDLEVSDRFQRTPLLLVGCAAQLSCWAAMDLSGCRVGGYVALSYGLVTMAVAALNKTHTKVSIHAAGVAGPAAMLTFMGQPFLLLATILWAALPLVAWSRRKKGAHSPYQLVLGAAVGAAVTAVAFLIYPPS